ncbi:type II toxin-antitoxin system RelE/ParE family toxin [Brevundimonas sp.]|uniref:type II toxin-antitoxin system RelE/ParE family toxin n=1 Tax=Brevundimonas sp. TaxID=1871086 RepID=UPI003565BAAB
MVEVIRSRVFAGWLDGLGDRRAAARIIVRIERLGFGQLGDHKSVGGGVTELRIDYGPGYRVYLLRRGGRLIVLLCGGDKSSQARDIAAAHAMAAAFKETPDD